MSEFGPVDHITVGAVGSPGERTFLLQARWADRLLCLLVEKYQVIELGRVAEELFSRLGYVQAGVSWTESEMAIDENAEPDWRVGHMEVGGDDDRDLVFLDCEELATDAEALLGPERVTIVMSREQFGVMAAYGLVVASRGRPLCPLCGLPMDPEGHTCVATNGHRKADPNMFVDIEDLLGDDEDEEEEPD